MAEIPPTRASLLVRLRDRQDSLAWAEFVKLYVPVVYGYLRKQGLQDADAADLCQEVLRAVAGAISRLEYDAARGAFRNWLFTIVRRDLSNWQRTRRVRSQTTEADRAVDLDQCPAREAEETAWDTEWEERLFAWACEQVRREVADHSWQAFWRTAIDGVPGKQVAQELGISVVAVYNARSRIRARLKQLVQDAQEP